MYYMCEVCGAAIKPEAYVCSVAGSNSRWYCGICGARYKTRFGVLFEMRLTSRVLYCRSPLPCDPCELIELVDGFLQFHAVLELSAASTGASAVGNVIAEWFAAPITRVVSNDSAFINGAFLTNSHQLGHYHVDRSIWSHMLALTQLEVGNAFIFGVMMSVYISRQQPPKRYVELFENRLVQLFGFDAH